MDLDLNNRTTVGSWLQLADLSLAEMMARAGFDWLCIDLEHTTTTLAQAGDLIRVVDGCGVPVFARMPSHDSAGIKRILDAGARGIIVPKVNTADEARAIVDAAFYPPKGSRGVGLARAQGFGTGFDRYRDMVEPATMVIAQIEHIEGVDNLREILDVDGISGFFIGPYDLSASLGTPGDFDNPKVIDALARIDAVVAEGNHLAGLHVVEPDIVKVNDAIGRGYRFIALASEMLILSHRLAEISAGLDRVR